MRYLTADIIYTAFTRPIFNGLLVLDDSGCVQAIYPNCSSITNEKLEYFKGALCPGFINTHCHLELSHMRAKIQQKTGLPSFISDISQKREATQQEILSAIKDADHQMKNNGIVAVGDISNLQDSFVTKAESQIKYHTFIELFGSDSSQAEVVFKVGIDLQQICPKPNSLTPHATYSLSELLFEKIANNNEGQIISIHNQETSSEDLFFKEGKGELNDFLAAKREFPITSKTAVESILPRLPKTKSLLVHNTYSSKEDVKWVEANYSDVYWSTCPKANVYIEGRTPDYSLFENSKMTIGTDSLASNDTLCVLSEMKVIQQNAQISLERLIEWSCKNGAEFLNFDSLGTFEIGKKPGVNWLQNLNSENFQLTEDTSVKAITFIN